MNILLVTGQSGAGKTLVVRNLEDMGFFCMDNLPPAMLPGVIELLSNMDKKQTTIDFERIAVVIDIRSGDFLKELTRTLEEIEEKVNVDILFMDASDEVLIKRFKETRRKHPLEKNSSLIQAIALERNRLKPLKDKATYIVDTSAYTRKQLREVLRNLLKDKHAIDDIMISVSSFGFKHGIPIDADIVFDVRFLPNPFYVENLRNQTGKDTGVRDFIFAYPQANQFVEKLIDLVNYLIPYYIQEDKSHLVIAIGCTGGRHRSVAVAEKLAERLKEKQYSVYVEHRDITRR